MNCVLNYNTFMLFLLIADKIVRKRCGVWMSWQQDDSSQQAFLVAEVKKRDLNRTLSKECIKPGSRDFPKDTNRCRVPPGPEERGRVCVLTADSISPWRCLQTALACDSATSQSHKHTAHNAPLQRQVSLISAISRGGKLDMRMKDRRVKERSKKTKC